MEVVAPCDKSDHLAISSSIGSSIDIHNSNQRGSSDLSMNDLNSCFTKCLKIEDGEISKSGSLSLYFGKNDIGNGVRKHECQSTDKINSSNSCSDKCLGKCATFPPHHGPKSSEGLFLSEEERHGEDISVGVPEVNRSTKPSDQDFLRSTSLPVPLKLTSAMKGSREKQGLPPMKLSVTWAPDVYDPIPTSVSHVPSYTIQRHGKKYGKHKKGLGKSSQGGGNKGKSKKQSRKNPGELNKLKPFHGADFGSSQVGSIEFGVGSPISSCERSFLKTSVPNLHFPVAEAS